MWINCVGPSLLEEKDKWDQERNFQGTVSKLLLLKAKITKLNLPSITFLNYRKTPTLKKQKTKKNNT